MLDFVKDLCTQCHERSQNYRWVMTREELQSNFLGQPRWKQTFHQFPLKEDKYFDYVAQYK